MKKTIFAALLFLPLLAQQVQRLHTISKKIQIRYMYALAKVQNVITKQTSARA